MHRQRKFTSFKALSLACLVFALISIRAPVNSADHSGPPRNVLQRLPPVHAEFQKNRFTESNIALSSFDLPQSESSPEEEVIAAEPSSESTTNETKCTMQQAWAVAEAVDQRLHAYLLAQSSAEYTLLSAQRQRWPSLSLNASYNYQSNESAFRFQPSALPLPLPTNVFLSGQDEYVSVHTGVQIPLYTSGKIQHSIDGAATRLEATSYSYLTARSDLLFDVGREYVNILRAQRDLEVARMNVRRLQSHLHGVQHKHAQGYANRSDVLEATVTLSNARQSVSRISGKLNTARGTLNRRLGRPLDSPLTLTEPQVDVELSDVESMTERAVEQSHELSRLSARIRQLHHQAETLRAEYGPQVHVEGGYQFVENRFAFPEGIGAIHLVSHWKPYDGGRNRLNAKAMDQEASQLASRRSDTESRIRLAVHNAYLEIDDAASRVELAVGAVENADQNVDVLKKRYAAGDATSTEVLDAHALWAETHRNYHHATYDLVLAKLQLLRAMERLDP